MSSELREQVLEFHRVFEHPIGKDGPKVPTDGRVRFRASLIAEEFFEMLCAMFPHGTAVLSFAEEHVKEVIKTSPVSVNLEDAVDAWGDIDYVIEGARLEFGVDGGPIAREIHRANMMKAHPCPVCENRSRVLPDCDRCHGTGLVIVKNAASKTIKPAGWKPPDIAGELARQQAPDEWPKADR